MNAIAPVLRDDSIYLTDNGRAVCGKHAGHSARFTGRDISGQRVLEVTAGMAEGFAVECETCGATPRKGR